MKKWRLEYQIESTSGRKFWRIYVDEVQASTEIFSYTEMRDHVSEDHPVMKYMRDILSTTKERIVIKPYEPFDPSPEVIEATDPEFPARIHAKEEACKFWSSRDGWVWLHYPGDSIA